MIDSYELKASLKNSIEDWINKMCDEDMWIDLDFYCQPELSQRMSDAAYSVLSACVENQRYAKFEGVFKDKK